MMIGYDNIVLDVDIDIHIKFDIVLMQACSLSVKNPTRTINSWRSRASKQQANFAPQLAYCMGGRLCQYVFSATDVDALLTPGLLKTQQRKGFLNACTQATRIFCTSGGLLNGGKSLPVRLHCY